MTRSERMIPHLSYGMLVWKCSKCNVGDPSRIGKIRANQKYMQLGAAGQDRIEDKMATHREQVREVGPLTHAVDFSPVAFEVGGGFTKSVSKWLDRVVETKHKNDKKLVPGKRKKSVV